MLNQFIQICIQTRNVGLFAAGCLIDELIVAFDTFFRHKAQPLHRLTAQGSGFALRVGGEAWLLGYRLHLLRFWSADTLLSSYRYAQG